MDWLRKNKKFLIIVMGGILLLLLYRFYPILMQKNEEEDYLQQADFFAGGGETSVEAIEEEEKVTVMLIDVKGAVKNPGVYEASEGDRVNDIIIKAGGILEKGEKNAVNFAMKVTDEMIIYVPFIGEEEEGAIMKEASNQASSSSNEGLININKASETELLQIPGVGPAKATAIIEYREQNGGFSAKEDMKKISGIGEKTYEKLEAFITIN
jgi:competence protein ComEA